MTTLAGVELVEAQATIELEWFVVSNNNALHVLMPDIDERVRFLRHDHAAHQDDQRATRIEKSVASSQALRGIRGARLEPMNRHVFGNFYGEQPEVIGQKFARQIEVDQDLEHRETGRGGGIDHGEPY